MRKVRHLNNYLRKPCYRMIPKINNVEIGISDIVRPTMKFVHGFSLIEIIESLVIGNNDPFARDYYDRLLEKKEKPLSIVVDYLLANYPSVLEKKEVYYRVVKFRDYSDRTIEVYYR